MSPAVDQATSDRIFAYYRALNERDVGAEANTSITPISVDAIGVHHLRVALRQVARTPDGTAISDVEVQHILELDDNGDVIRMDLRD